MSPIEKSPLPSRFGPPLAPPMSPAPPEPGAVTPPLPSVVLPPLPSVVLPPVPTAPPVLVAPPVPAPIAAPEPRYMTRGFGSPQPCSAAVVPPASNKANHVQPRARAGIRRFKWKLFTRRRGRPVAGGCEKNAAQSVTPEILHQWLAPARLVSHGLP